VTVSDHWIALNFVTSESRNAAIQQFETLCHDSGVFIVDFHMFSNVSLSVQFEAAVPALLNFTAALTQSSFHITGDSQVSLALLPASDSQSRAIGTMQVTFACEDGNLRIAVPNVPG
jgi:hypothetical protein